MNPQNRKYYVLFLILLVLSPLATVHATVEDSNTGVATGYEDLRRKHPSSSTYDSSVGIRFTAASGYFFNQSQFYLRKHGTVSGDSYAVLYTVGGGTLPDVELARSEPFDISDLGVVADWVLFNFTTPYKLTAAATYFICFENPSVGVLDSNNYVEYGYIATGDTSVTYSDGAWGWDTQDPMFFVVSMPIHVIDCEADAQFLNAQLGWVNVTVWAGAGVADIKTVDIQVNTTGDAETGTLRWTQATGVFSEVSDPDAIFTLGVGVRTNINATYDLVSFEFSLNNGTTGLCDVYATAINDADIEDSVLYGSSFVLVSVDWSGIVYSLIDEVFALFGIPNFITSLTTLITSFSSQFAASMVRLAQLVYQQFRIIGAVFNFFIYWFTAMTDIVLQFSLFYQSILNNTAAWGNGIGNLWLFLNYDSWAPILPLVIFIWWFDSVEKRGTQTVGGMLQVLINDANTVISITSYFVGMFSLIINTIIDRVYGLFDAMP